MDLLRRAAEEAGQGARTVWSCVPFLPWNHLEVACKHSGQESAVSMWVGRWGPVGAGGGGGRPALQADVSLQSPGGLVRCGSQVCFLCESPSSVIPTARLTRSLEGTQDDVPDSAGSVGGRVSAWAPGS